MCKKQGSWALTLWCWRLDVCYQLSDFSSILNCWITMMEWKSRGVERGVNCTLKDILIFFCNVTFLVVIPNNVKFLHFITFFSFNFFIFKSSSPQILSQVKAVLETDLWKAVHKSLKSDLTDFFYNTAKKGNEVSKISICNVF